MIIVKVYHSEGDIPVLWGSIIELRAYPLHGVQQ